MSDEDTTAPMPPLNPTPTEYAILITGNTSKVIGYRRFLINTFFVVANTF